MGSLRDGLLTTNDVIVTDCYAVEKSGFFAPNRPTRGRIYTYIPRPYGLHKPNHAHHSLPQCGPWQW